MHITLVTKIKPDGSKCRKCLDVEKRLAAGGFMARINTTVVADERDPHSAGMQLAAKHNIDVAPFFIVTDDAGAIQTYTVYFRFIKEVLQGATNPLDEAAELMEQSSDLDYL